MRSYSISILVSSLLLGFVITGCQKKVAGISEMTGVKVHELKAYNNLISTDNLLLGLPIRLKYDDNTQHLFIQDPDHWGIIEIDDSSNVVNTFGSRGRGPGEIQVLSDFFLTKDHLFIVDSGQYLIHKYSHLDGQHIASLDYRKLMAESKNISGSNGMILPKPPFMDNNNQPFVTLNETILLPSHANGNFLYQAVNWDGEKLADIGEMPTECRAKEDNDKIKSALENREVPNRDFCLAFPVNDHSNPEEIYLVYSAIASIVKYDLTGEKIWQHPIPETPEVDSLMIDRSDIMKSRPNGHSSLEPVRKYITGRSGPDGDLFLVTYTNLHTPIYLRPM